MKPADDILKEFLDANHVEGTLIPKTYFWELFGLKEPKGLMKVGDTNQANFRFMGAIEKLKSELLEHHKQDLQNVHTKGYRLVPFLERVAEAVTDGTREIRRHVKRTRARLINMDHPEQLNLDSQRQRDHMLSALEMTSRLMNKSRRYPE